jgi:hypothetical protein
MRYHEITTESESAPDAGLAPDIGTIFLFHDRRYLLKGWMRPTRGTGTLIDCPREDATHVSGGSCQAPLTAITVVGRLDDTTEHGKWKIAEMRQAALRRQHYVATRETETDRLATQMDMTPEGYVYEWDQHGRTSIVPLPAWEYAYERLGLITAAERAGYISVGRDVAGTIHLEREGQRLLAMIHRTY